MILDMDLGTDVFVVENDFKIRKQSEWDFLCETDIKTFKDRDYAVAFVAKYKLENNKEISRFERRVLNLVVEFHPEVLV